MQNNFFYKIVLFRKIKDFILKDNHITIVFSFIFIFFKVILYDYKKTKYLLKYKSYWF